MTDPFDACRVAYEQGREDALAACITVIQSFDWDINTGMDFTVSDIIAAIKGDH